MSKDNREKPELSVVVAIIAGGREATENCLKALKDGSDGVNLECIVPYDSRLDDVEGLKRQFRWAKFLDAQKFVDAEQFGEKSREHHDILRAVGLRQATAPIIALLEDHGTPSKDWCKSLMKLHKKTDAAAIGGAVENGVDRLLNWAVYYCDFGRYQNPVPIGNVEFLSDSNVSYKRDALWSVKNLWFVAFHETSVNWELKRRGKILRLNPEMIVYQTRSTLRFIPALKERFVWGRSFAGTRSKDITTSKRIKYGVFSFLLPFLLTIRIALNGISKKRHIQKLIASLPLIFLLQIFWATGEFVGYLTGRASAQENLQMQVEH